jgi:hypothetical protein
MSSLKLREVIKQIRTCKTAAEERGVISKESALIRNAFKVISLALTQLGKLLKRKPKPQHREAFVFQLARLSDSFRVGRMYQTCLSPKLHRKKNWLPWSQLVA